MKIGIALTTSVTPAVTAVAQADYVRRVAAASEEAGYDSVWVSDRTVFPSDLAQRYPDMYGPGKADPDAQNVLEAITTLSYVAGATSRVKLGISVLVLPFRNPVLNAKMVTTLDVMSGGRAIFGIGVGWMPEEFASMGAEFEHRGAQTDEHIEMYQALCTQDVADYQGEHFQISGMTFFPRPVKKPYPPIWVGGNSDVALRRAARLGDAWHGIRLTPEEVAAKKARLASLCDANGRDSNSVQTTLRATMVWGQYQRNPDGSRAMLTGSPDEIRNDLLAYQEAGLDYLVMSVAADDIDTTINNVESFAEEGLLAL